jgi:hypothetical protein
MFTRIVNGYGKVFPDNLLLQILGKQEMDIANSIIYKLKLNLTHQEFLQKVRDEEEKTLKNATLMYGKYIITLYKINHYNLFRLLIANK